MLDNFAEVFFRAYLPVASLRFWRTWCVAHPRNASQNLVTKLRKIYQPFPKCHDVLLSQTLAGDVTPARMEHAVGAKPQSRI